jgi:hypothetical protein
MSLTSSYPRVLRRVLALLTAVVLVSWGTAALSRADAVENNQVCSGLDSGKIDVSGEKTSITLTAPEGQLITGYCVKAGSTKNGNGPRYVTLSQPQKSVTISYPGGKAISHYSVDYTTDDNEPEVCEEGPNAGQPIPEGETEESFCNEPDEADDEVCEEGPNAGQPIPEGETEESFCEVDTDNPGGDNPGGDNPGGDNPGGDNPGGDNPGGNDAGDTEVLGAQASIGAGAPSGAGSSAPSGGATQVPTAVNAGVEDPNSAYAGLRSALALLMVAFGLFVIGMAIKPTPQTNPRHRNN